MTTAYRKVRQKKRKALRREDRRRRRAFHGWCQVICWADCGCCQAILWISTPARATAIMEELVRHQVVLVGDDMGNFFWVDGQREIAVRQL